MVFITNQKGQSLLEVVVGVSIVAVVLSGMIAAVNYALSNSQFARNKASATKYGQEAIEWLREQRESIGWAAFYYCTDPTATYCLNSLASNLNAIASGGCSSGTYISGTNFVRQVTLTGNGTGGGNNRDRVTIVMTVFWTAGARTTSVTFNTYLTKWK